VGLYRVRKGWSGREVWYAVHGAAGFAGLTKVCRNWRQQNLRRYHILKEFVCGALSAALAVCCLTACSAPNEQHLDPAEMGAITDFTVGDVEVHEALLPWQFEEGEEVENPYYKRTSDENGVNAYAVLKASDNQVAYLPMSNTVVYMGNSDDCYFERTTNTYKLDGEDQTVVQFQLYVSGENSAGEPQTAAKDAELETNGPADSAVSDATEENNLQAE